MRISQRLRADRRSFVNSPDIHPMEIYFRCSSPSAKRLGASNKSLADCPSVDRPAHSKAIIGNRKAPFPLFLASEALRSSSLRSQNGTFVSSGVSLRSRALSRDQGRKTRAAIVPANCSRLENAESVNSPRSERAIRLMRPLKHSRAGTIHFPIYL